MKPRRISQRQLASRHRSLADLFGQIPVTRLDVYAWLLGVVDMDPSSPRALEYFRGYGVAHKIVVAKLEGTFDAVTASARTSARYRELIAEPPAPVTSANVAGLSDWPRQPEKRLPSAQMQKAARRPSAVVQKEKARMRRETAVRKQLRTSPLGRIPSSLPALEHLLDDLGGPTAEMLALALDVSPSTARRWVSNGAAPKAVLIALYWMTNRGLSNINIDAHNRAMFSAQLTRSLQERVAELERLLADTARIGEFGSANDPSPLTPGTPVAVSPALAPVVKPARELEAA